MLAIANALLELAVDGQSKLEAVVVDSTKTYRLCDPGAGRRHLVGQRSETAILVWCAGAVVVGAASTMSVGGQQSAARSRRHDSAARAALSGDASPVLLLLLLVVMMMVVFRTDALQAAQTAIAIAAGLTDGAGWSTGRSWTGAATRAQLGLLAGSVLVIRILLHVKLTEALRFSDVG